MWCARHHLAMIEPPRDTMPVTRFGRQRDVAKQHAGVHGEVVHPLLRLLDQGVAIDLPGQVLRHAADFLQRLVDRHRPDRDRPSSG